MCYIEGLSAGKGITTSALNCSIKILAFIFKIHIPGSNISKSTANAKTLGNSYVFIRISNSDIIKIYNPAEFFYVCLICIVMSSWHINS